MTSYNLYEKALLETLISAKRPLTTKQIAEITKVNWITARKYLERLNRAKNNGRPILYKLNKNNKIYWAIEKADLKELIS
tara:strand:- start:5854 stop:6093 length:240 start_codon:yes stop_codon:yes gene_type:complete